MGDILLGLLAVSALVSTPIGIVWFSQINRADPQPFSYTRVVLLGYLCCVAVIWGVMAAAPIGGRPAIVNWGLTASLSWLASVAMSCALAMFAPVLLAYGAARRLSRPKALFCAAALGGVNLALFAFFFGGLSCVVFFAC